jgi:uncharacterized protein (DUF58 family)
VSRATAIGTGGLLLVLIAFTFDAAPLFVPGIAFALIGLGARVWVSLSARGAAIDRKLLVERVVEDEPLEATIDITRGRLGLPGAYIDDPLVGDPLAIGEPLSLKRSGGRRTTHVEIVARFPRRGVVKVEPPALVIRDPLSLAQVRLISRSPGKELMVLPRTEAVEWREDGRGRYRTEDAGDSPADPHGAADVDGLRPYRQGTPASRIHWRSLARGAGLLERRLTADGDTRPMIVLDARGEGPPELLDAAVRATASLTLELARHGGCGLLLPGDRRASAIEPDLTGWPAAHARLALVQGGPEARAPVLRSNARTGPVFYVTAQAPDPTDFGAALATLTRSGATAVLPRELCGEIRQRPSFAVSGCVGFALTARTRLAAAAAAGSAA